MSIPNAPAGTGAAGRRMWRAIQNNYELEEHETALLVEAVRTVDLLEKLDSVVRDEGAMVESPQGVKAHPAAVEARQQRIALARLLAALRLPVGDEEGAQANARPRRRVGVRGVYGIRGSVA